MAVPGKRVPVNGTYMGYVAGDDPPHSFLGRIIRDRLGVRELLPVVYYLCQGLIAPEFAGIDLGLAEKLAVRAVAAATRISPAEVTAPVRQTGDLGLAAEELLAAAAAGGPA